MPSPPELNRLVVTLSDLGTPDGVSPSTVTELMRTVCLGGRLPDHRLTLDFARVVGLLEGTRARVRLSRRGLEFLDLNRGHSYNLTQGQAPFLANLCLFSGPYAAVAADLFRAFRRDSASRTFSADLGAFSPQTRVHRTLINFARHLGVLRTEGSIAFVTEPYIGQVSRLRVRRAVTPQELDRALERRRHQGSIAEECALEFERERLRRAGYPIEAAAVEHVSAYDVMAGYDIASFNGASTLLEFDRFVEVKSTSRPEPVFFWSEHERAVAEELGSQYWIYLYTGFSSELVKNGCSAYPITIPDPAAECHPRGLIRLTPTEFRAELRSDIISPQA